MFIELLRVAAGQVAEDGFYQLAMMRGHGIEGALPCCGKTNALRATIARGSGAGDQPFLHQPRSEAREIAVADQKTTRQLAHGKPFARFTCGHVELREHVEARERARKIFAEPSAHA